MMKSKKYSIAFIDRDEYNKPKKTTTKTQKNKRNLYHENKNTIRCSGQNGTNQPKPPSKDYKLFTI